MGALSQRKGMANKCHPTPRNESLCAFEKSEKKGKVKKVFCQNRPDMTTALQTCYDIKIN
jgi:hypothetical protein